MARFAAPARAAAVPLTAVRHKSGPYGYTQAKALVFSNTGEPGDVLKYVYFTYLTDLPCTVTFCHFLPSLSPLTRYSLSHRWSEEGGKE